MRVQIILLILIGLVILAAGVAYLSLFTVSQNEVVIVTRFGKPVRTLDDPGLYAKWPGLFETVNRLDKRIHIFKNQPTQLLLKDKNPIIVGCYICWKIHDPEVLFQRVTTIESATGKIGDMINSQLGSVLGTYDLDNIINVDAQQVKLDEIETRVRENTENQARKEYGIEIVRIGIRRLAYPNIVEQSVYSRMRAEREKEASKYRAQGREEAAKIEADTDQQVKKIMAEAYRDAEIRKGEGDKESMRIYADAYGKDTKFFEFLKSLEIYKETLRDNTTLILSTDSELFKHLNYRMEGSGTEEERPPVEAEGSHD
jgi:membrane protease subunit HflC